jgi:hypothetical protein
LKASIVGSSWNSADTNGVAPIRSPAETKMVFFGLVARNASTCVARYSTPPANVAPMRPAEPIGGSSAPWKSFRPSTWISTVLSGLGGLCGLPPWRSPDAPAASVLAPTIKPMMAVVAPSLESVFTVRFPCLVESLVEHWPRTARTESARGIDGSQPVAHAPKTTTVA